ncbi:MAG: phytoene desaturase family protein, partial [Caldilineaceae bacterium]
AMADWLGGLDGFTYQQVIGPLVNRWRDLIGDLLAPLHLPGSPIAFARFMALAALPAASAAALLFRAQPARALIAGMAGHSMLPLERSPTMGIALILTLLGHAVGWPLARGGSQTIADAMAAMLHALGGEIVTGWEVASLEELPPARVLLFDTTPRQLLQIAHKRLPPAYQRTLSGFRHNPGVFKVDWALAGPVPWRDPIAHQTATLHLGGAAAELAAGERGIWKGKHADRPFVLFSQPTIFDDSRAPVSRHVAWGYCHVPAGSTVDMTARIEAQVDRFAPGFRDLILARHTFNTAEMQGYNPNYIGGDVNGGVQDLFQHFNRPTLSLSPYRTAGKGIYLCSSSTPPGGGVHGMCGYHAARAVLEDLDLPFPTNLGEIIPASFAMPPAPVTPAGQSPGLITAVP